MAGSDPQNMKKPLKNPGGRPTIMTEETLEKLKQAFLIGASDKEACAFAEISNQTLYDYQERNPKYVEWKEKWKLNPFLKARNTVVKALSNPRDAQWYLERKNKAEFAERKEVTGDEGKELILKIVEDTQLKKKD